MDGGLAGTVALVTGASSGIGSATARALAGLGASVAVVARRRDRLNTVVADLEAAGASVMSVSADITVREQAEAAVEQIVRHFGRLDILVNNAGLMLISAVTDADIDDWEQMIAINQLGLLYTTHAALPHLLAAAERGPREVADIVNISSVAGRVSFPDFGVYNMTKFGVNGFSEALRKEITERHVRVGVLEPGGVDTELVSHNSPDVRRAIAERQAGRKILDPVDIAEGVAFMVTRPRHATIGELWVMPTTQV